MSADSALELAKLLIDHPDIAEAIKGMAVVHNTYKGPTTVYIACSFGGNGGGGNKSPSSKGRKGRGRPTVTLDTSFEDEEVADEEEDGEDTSPAPAPAPAPTVSEPASSSPPISAPAPVVDNGWGGSASNATSTSAPAPVEAPKMGYQEASKIWARLDGLSERGEITEEVPSINQLKDAHPNWVTAFGAVPDDKLDAVIAAFNLGVSSPPPPF